MWVCTTDQTNKQTEKQTTNKLTKNKQTNKQENKQTNKKSKILLLNRELHFKSRDLTKEIQEIIDPRQITIRFSRDKDLS